MSFDIHFFKFSAGEGGEMPRQALLDLLQSHSHKQTGDEFYDIQLSDGSHVEFDAIGLSGSQPISSCALYIRGMSDDIFRLAFQIAKTTSCVMIPTMEKNPCILIDESQRAELPPDLGLPILECRSPEELGQLIAPGYRDWSRYRDQVIQSYDKPAPPAQPEH